MIQTLKKFIWILGENKNYFFYLIIPFIIISFIEALSIAVLIPLLDIISGSAVTEKKIYLFLKNNFNINNFKIELFLALLVLVLFVFKNIFHFYLNKYFFKYCFDIQSKIRGRIINKVNENYFHYNYSLNEINKLIAFSTERFANNSMIPIMQSVPDIALFIFLIFLLGFQQPITMILMILSLSLSLILFILFFKKKYIIWGQKYNLTAKNILSNTANAINGIEELKILGKENFFTEVSQKYSNSFAFYAAKYRLFQKLPRQFVEIIILFSIIIIFLMNDFLQVNTSSIFINLTLFGIVGIRLIPIFGSILFTINEIRFSKNSIDDLYKILNSKNQKRLNHSLFPKTVFKNLEIKNLKNKNINTIFHSGINLKIKKNDLIGIYGASGVGKSTLLKNLSGINLNQITGNILLNGNKITKENVNRLISMVYLVKQDPIFFEGKLKNNIALGLGDNEIDEVKVKNSLLLSNSNFIFKRKKGINSNIEQNAKNFSAGQKQRLAIARALYYDREILLFDEITSNLDAASILSIIKLIKKLSKKKTIIIISHDLSFLSICKKIYELKSDGIFKKNKKII